MLNAKIIGVALLFALGGTSFAIAGTDTDNGGTFNQGPATYSTSAPLQEGRSVYIAPAHNGNAPVRDSIQNGSNAPAH